RRIVGRQGIMAQRIVNPQEAVQGIVLVLGALAVFVNTCSQVAGRIVLEVLNSLVGRPLCQGQRYEPAQGVVVVLGDPAEGVGLGLEQALRRVGELRDDVVRPAGTDYLGLGQDVSVDR